MKKRSIDAVRGEIMMGQFKRVYWPGGMGLGYSKWILVQVIYDARLGTIYRHLADLELVKE